MSPPATRRAVLASALALAACGREVRGEPTGPVGPLKSLAPFPVGCCVQTGELADPAFVALLTRNFSQITPEWEMKMEYIAQRDGTFRFDAPDAIAAFAKAHGLRLYGTTLIWYAQKPDAFTQLDERRIPFAEAYRNYILAVAGRYRGQAVGWDVVNEPVAEDGAGLRECLWSQKLGMDDYMLRAFDHAAEADPAAVRFINEYNLESLPAKRATFMRLVERLLNRGAKIGGIGTQSHIDIDLPAGAVKTAIAELAHFGLPLHVSELDVSLGRRPMDLRGRSAKLDAQARRAEEVAEAFCALPARQRFAFTAWGLRDRDSWLMVPSRPGSQDDAPLLFDDGGAPKPALAAVAAAFARAR